MCSIHNPLKITDYTSYVLHVQINVKHFIVKLSKKAKSNFLLIKLYIKSILSTYFCISEAPKISTSTCMCKTTALAVSDHLHTFLLMLNLALN